jgi:hypothetical protein
MATGNSNGTGSGSGGGTAFPNPITVILDKETTSTILSEYAGTLANALASAYINIVLPAINANDITQIKQQQAYYQQQNITQQISNYQDQIDNANATIAATTDPAQLTQTKPIYEQQIAQYQRQIKKLEAQLATLSSP